MILVSVGLILYLGVALRRTRHRSYEMWSWYERAVDIHTRLRRCLRYEDGDVRREAEDHIKSAPRGITHDWLTSRYHDSPKITRTEVAAYSLLRSMFWPVGYVRGAVDRSAVYVTSPTKKARRERQLENAREQRDYHVAHIESLERELKVGDYAEA